MRKQPGSRRLAGLFVIAIAGLLALGACGVPDDARPVIDGDGPRGVAQQAPVNAQAPDGPSGVTSDDELIQRYLMAAAVPPDQRLADVRLFLTKATKNRLTTGTPPTLTVVRVAIVPSLVTNADTRATIQPLGSLTDRGTVEGGGGASYNWDFDVVNEDGQLLINNPLPGFVLSDTALNRYFTLRTIYFWDNKYDSLVPDLRYVPLWLNDRPLQVPTLIVNWLIGGASPWLQPAVLTLPVNTALATPTVQSIGNTLVVKLTAAAAQETRLGAQLRWSLGPFWPGPIALQVEGQPPVTVNNDASITAANLLVGQPTTLYGIVGGSVRALTVPRDDQLPVFLAKENSNVLSAALTHDRTALAVVRQGSDGQGGAGQSLWLGGRPKRPIDVFEFFKVDKWAPHNIGRPAWLGKSGRLLVPADGELYTLSVDSPQPRKVTPPNMSVAAVAAAADGHRIALITTGGQAYVASVGDDGDIFVTRALGVGLASVTNLAWSAETSVIATGRDGEGKSAIVEASVDSAMLKSLNSNKGLATASITGLAVLPADPLKTKYDQPIIIQESASGILTVGSTQLTGVVFDGSGTPGKIEGPVQPSALLFAG